jgi:hypothetical protein
MTKTDRANLHIPVDQLTEQSPRHALAIVAERGRLSASLFPGPAPMLAAWGCTYLLGFGTLWLTVGRHGPLANWGPSSSSAGSEPWPRSSPSPE